MTCSLVFKLSIFNILFDFWFINALNAGKSFLYFALYDVIHIFFCFNTYLISTSGIGFILFFLLPKKISPLFLSSLPPQ